MSLFQFSSELNFFSLYIFFFVESCYLLSIIITISSIIYVSSLFNKINSFDSYPFVRYFLLISNGIDILIIPSSQLFLGNSVFSVFLLYFFFVDRRWPFGLFDIWQVI